MSENDPAALAARLSDRQRRTILGLAGLGEPITERADDLPVLEGLGLVRDEGGRLHLTPLGRRVATLLHA